MILVVLKFEQNTTNIDGTTKMGNINVAAGLELRSENFRIYAGETASYANGQAGTSISGWDSSYVDTTTGVTQYVNLNSKTAGSGCQCFSGFKPSNELATKNADRSVTAFYGDAEMDMGMLRIGGAVRFESYNDTQLDGSDHKYSNMSIKGSVRAEPMSGVVVRSAFSTGFRAPALAQAYQAKIAN